MRRLGSCRAIPRRTLARKMESRPVSRVLSRTAIHLGPPSPAASSDLPEPSAGRAIGFLFGLAPGGVYRAAICCQSRGALLPHPFTLTGAHQERLGGLLSAALVVGSHPPGVTWHPALRSPDFPPRPRRAKRLFGRLSERSVTRTAPRCKRIATPQSTGYRLTWQ